jgi:hypothetical protein
LRNVADDDEEFEYKPTPVEYYHTFYYHYDFRETKKEEPVKETLKGTPS